MKIREKNEMLSLTDLKDGYEQLRKVNNWPVKDINAILKRDKNNERILASLFEYNKIEDLDKANAEVKELGLVPYLKKYGFYKTEGRWENKNVMVDKSIWINVAFELHPYLFAKTMSMLINNDRSFFEIEEK